MGGSSSGRPLYRRRTAAPSHAQEFSGARLGCRVAFNQFKLRNTQL